MEDNGSKNNEVGKESLTINRKAVSSEDTVTARESSIALSEEDIVEEGFTEEGLEGLLEETGADVEDTLYVEDYYSDGKAGHLSNGEISKRSVEGAIASDDVSENRLVTFETISKELNTDGVSQKYSEIEDRVLQIANNDFELQVQELAGQGMAEEVFNLVSNVERLIEEESSVMNYGLRNLSEDQLALDPSVRSQEYQEWYNSKLFETRRAQESINRILDKYVSESDSSLGGAVVDLGGTLIVSEQLFLGRAAEKILGERYYALGGTMKEDLANWILAGGSEEEIAKRAEVVAQEVSDAAGVQSLGGNDFVKVFALETIRDYINQPSGEVDWIKYVDNIAGVVGVVPLISEQVIASAARRLIASARTAASSGRNSRVLDDIQEASPDLASDLNVAAIADEGVATNLNMTREEASLRALPHGAFEPDVHLEGAPQKLVDDLKGIQSKADAIDDYVENTFLFSGETAKNSKKIMADILNSSKISAVVKPSISTMERVGNKIKMSVVYGDDTAYPISTLEEAVEIKSLLEDTFKSARGVDVGATVSVSPKARVLVKDEVTGVFGPPSEVSTATTKPRYYVSIDKEIPMLYSDAVPGLHDITKDVGKYGRWLIPPNNYISKNLLGSANIANEKKAFVTSELKNLATPFLSLKRRGQLRVASLLEEGENFANADGTFGKVFKYSELKNSYTDEEIKAYMSVRQFNETVWRIKNNDLRERLLKDNYKALVVDFPDGAVYNNTVKELDSVPEGVEKVYNVVTKEAVDISSDTDLQKAIHDGYVLAKAQTKVVTDSGHYGTLLVRKQDIKPLPLNVMAYKKGYNFRVNKDPYFVREYFVGKVDGVVKEVDRVVGVAETSRQAESWAKALRAENPKGVYRAELDRNISSTESLLKQDYDMLDGSGLQFWHSQRGERLTRRDGSLSAVEDPVAAIHRLSAAVGNVASHSQMFESAISMHQKKYGNIAVNGRKLWEYDPKTKRSVYIGKDLNESANPEIRAANSEYKYLEGLKEMPTTFDLQWRDLMLGLDKSVLSKVDNKVGDALSKAAIGASKITPGSVLRNTTFSLTIPLNPPRQVFLQWSTGMQLSGIDPVATAKAFRDSGLIKYSMAHWDNPKRWNRYVAPAARANGYSPEEWKEIFDQFRRTGKAYSIDSNVFIAEANFGWSRSLAQTSMQRSGQIARNVAMSPVTIGKKYGFDLGEFGNQAMSWMFARSQWIKKNPGKVWNSKQEYLDEISVLSRNYSVDMTKTNVLPYQKGGFATLTQFMSINHKMLFKILGKDPDIQGIEHYKYLGGLATMYGAAGLGLQDVYEKVKAAEGVEVPEGLDDAISGGLSQYVFNKSLDLAFNQDFGTTKTAFSDSFSPSSGIWTAPYDLVADMFEGNFLEASLGPSKGTFQRLGRAADHIATISGRKDYDSVEKLLLGADAAIKEFGIFSKMYDYELAMAYKQKVGEYHTVSRKGYVGVPTNEAELTAKLLLGLQTKNESAFYNQYLSMMSEHRSGKMETTLKKDAKRMAEWWFRNYLENSNDPDKFEEAVFPILNGIEDRYYGREVWKEARRMIRLKPDFPKLIMRITEQNQLFDADYDMEEMRNLVKTSDIATDTEKEDLSKWFDSIEAEMETARERYNNLGDL